MTDHRPPRAVTIPIDEDQLLVDEPALAPSITIAIAAPDPDALDDVATAVRALGYELIAYGAGRTGIDTVRSALRRASPPAVVLLSSEAAESLVEGAETVAPRSVLVLMTGAPIAHAAEQATALDVDLFMVAPYHLDRCVPILVAAARLADQRAQLLHARGNALVLQRRIEKLVNPDDDSGLHGAELVRRMLELELRRGKRYGYPLALVRISLGEGMTGDSGVQRILKVRAAAAISAAIRDIDLACADDHDFLILLPHTDRTAAGRVAHRLVRAVAEIPEITVGGVTHRLTPRAGVAPCARGGRPAKALLAEAEHALGQARRDHADLVVHS